MKKALRIIVSLIIIALVFTLFTSCEPHNYPNINRHSLIFEAGNEEYYLFSDHRQDSLNYPNREIPNGYELKEGIKYDFHFKGDTVYVEVGHSINKLKWYSQAINDQGKEVSVFGGKFKKKITENGYFVAEMPWYIID